MKMPKRLIAGAAVLMLSASPLLQVMADERGGDHRHGGAARPRGGDPVTAQYNQNERRPYARRSRGHFQGGGWFDHRPADWPGAERGRHR